MEQVFSCQLKANRKKERLTGSRLDISERARRQMKNHCCITRQLQLNTILVFTRFHDNMSVRQCQSIHKIQKLRRKKKPKCFNIKDALPSVTSHIFFKVLIINWSVDSSKSKWITPINTNGSWTYSKGEYTSIYMTNQLHKAEFFLSYNSHYMGWVQRFVFI